MSDLKLISADEARKKLNNSIFEKIIYEIDLAIYLGRENCFVKDAIWNLGIEEQLKKFGYKIEKLPEINEVRISWRD